MALQPVQGPHCENAALETTSQWMNTQPVERQAAQDDIPVGLGPAPGTRAMCVVWPPVEGFAGCGVEL